jgi:putative hemolysin
VHEVTAGDSVRSPEELRALVDEAQGSGVIPRAQEEMLHNVFDFASLEAGDVMVPAADVDWLDAELTAETALAKTAEHRRSRYPVGTGTLDRLVGVLHIQEILAAALAEPHSPVGTRAQPALIVPETKDLGALLRELRETRQQLAVVADEYGGIAGIVTMEDIVEEIVGEIEGEYDLPDDTLHREDDGTVHVAGSMTIDDFNEAVGTTLPEPGVRTMAGLMFSVLGRRPQERDTVTVASSRLTVEQVDGTRITRLRVEPETGPPHS